MTTRWCKSSRYPELVHVEGQTRSSGTERGAADRLRVAVPVLTYSLNIAWTRHADPEVADGVTAYVLVHASR